MALNSELPLQLAANLKAVALRHHHVEQNDAGRSIVMVSSTRCGSFEANGLVAFVFKKALHQLHLRRRVIDDEYFFLHARDLSAVLRRREVHVSGQLVAVRNGLCLSLLTR